MLPKTTLGIVSFMVFVGYLLSLVFQNKATVGITSVVQKAQTNIGSAANGLSDNPGIFGSITAVGTIIFNFLLMIQGMVTGTFIALASFISAVTLLPIIISQILIALVSIGLIFSIISVAVRT